MIASVWYMSGVALSTLKTLPVGICSVRNGSAPLGAVQCYHCRLCVLIFNVEFMPISDAKKYSASTKEGLERREGIHQACVSVFCIVLRPQAHCSFHVCT